MVDALDQVAVDEFVDTVAERAGAIDVSFNLISLGDVQQPPIEIWVEDFLQPITTVMRSHFVTTRAAARHMITRGLGVILAFGGGGRKPVRGWAASRSPSMPSRAFAGSGPAGLAGTAFAW